MMQEATLREFFLGRALAAELARQLPGSTSRSDVGVTSLHVIPMEGDFDVTSEMAVMLCDAALRGELKPEELETIAFAIVGSDHFCFEGETVLGEVLHDWAAPEINYPLTPENLRRFKRWLENVEAYPPK